MFTQEFTPEASPRSALWQVFDRVASLKFRLEAYYKFSIETSGVNETPFAMYVRTRLANAHVEIRAGAGGVPLGPYTVESMVKDTAIQCLAFDYDGVGKLDHIVAYLTGDSKKQSLIRFFGYDVVGTSRFSDRYDKNGSHDLLMGSNNACNIYDRDNSGVRVLPFDYTSSGKSDHLIVYKPGGGAMTIFKHHIDGHFDPVFNSRSGIGHFDLTRPDDRAFAFDYNGVGKLDHLVIYRPSQGALGIFKKRSDGLFQSVYETRHGIGRNGRLGLNDRVLAFDYRGTGKLDHLVVVCSGQREVLILTKNFQGGLDLVYGSSTGIGGYDLAKPDDRAFAVDYESVGKMDHLVLYRPGTGACFIVRRKGDNNFEALPGAQGDPTGQGIGGFNLKNPVDRAFAFDYDGFGKLDHLVLYRPGSGNVVVLKKGPQGGIVRVFG